MKENFAFDQRLGIQIPELVMEWDEISREMQEDILFYWEKIRGTIPDRIKELEDQINRKQAQLSEENDFGRSCELNSEIAELASIINDLWLWYRVDQNISGKAHQ